MPDTPPDTLPPDRDQPGPRGGWWLLALAVVLAAGSAITLAAAISDHSGPTPNPGPNASPSTGAGRPTSSPSPPPPAPRPVPVPTGAPPAPSVPSTSGPPEPPDPVAGPVSDEVLNADLRAQHPTDLDPLTETRVLTVARAALIADLTGVGRDAFPDYLPGDLPARQHTTVRVQAAAAHTVRGRRDLIEVRMLWAGITPAGVPVERRSAHVYLRHRDRVWEPIPTPR